VPLLLLHLLLFLQRYHPRPKKAEMTISLMKQACEKDEKGHKAGDSQFL
jgi:hypothetical protein